MLSNELEKIAEEIKQSYSKTIFELLKNSTIPLNKLKNIIKDLKKEVKDDSKILNILKNLISNTNQIRQDFQRIHDALSTKDIKRK